ncbi:MAG TPA: CHAT domain-containing protein, partial [Sphingobacteriaceae bacterium]
LLDSKPQIVHFSGHGTKSGGIVLENDDGKAHLVTPKAMSELFELFADEVECVILNACYSEVQAEAIVKHIKYVIGMSKEIGDKAAVEFAIGFYDALCDGKSVEIAFKFGRNAIQLEGVPEHLTPILKSKPNNKHSDSSEKKKRTKWVLVLSATIEDIDKEKAQAIVEHLKRLSKDSSLTLLEVKSGSVLLILESSPEEFNKIKRLFELKELTEVLGISILDVTLKSNISLPSKSKRIISQAAFDHFINWLGKGSWEEGGIRYEHIRSRLIKFFNYRNLPNMEDLADETLNRVIDNFSKDETSYESKLRQYIDKAAQLVYLEAFKINRSFVQLELKEASMAEDDTDSTRDCLDKCLQKLSETERKILLEYYEPEKKEKREVRARLASRHGFTIAELHYKVARIRLGLKKCVEECIKKELK